jgi:hypothetical protein
MFFFQVPVTGVTGEGGDVIGVRAECDKTPQKNDNGDFKNANHRKCFWL